MTGILGNEATKNMKQWWWWYGHQMTGFRALHNSVECQVNGVVLKVFTKSPYFWK